MAQDSIVMNDQNVNGMIAINKAVFQAITEISIQDIENAEPIPASPFSKPIQIKIIDNKLHIIADVKVTYGANVNATCELVQNKIYENITYMTGYKPNEVTVNVAGFSI